MTAEANDAIRRGIISASHYGSAQPPPEAGWRIATTANVAVLSGEKRDRLMDRVFGFDDFADGAHLSGTLDFEGVTAKFELRADSKTLLISIGDEIG